MAPGSAASRPAPTGAYQIATIPGPGLVTLTTNPFNCLSNKTGIGFQKCWRFVGTMGTAPVVSSLTEAQNVFKVRTKDSVGNNGELESICFVESAPAGAAFIALGGKSFTGQTVNVLARLWPPCKVGGSHHPIQDRGYGGPEAPLLGLSPPSDLLRLASTDGGGPPRGHNP